MSAERFRSVVATCAISATICVWGMALKFNNGVDQKSRHDESIAEDTKRAADALEAIAAGGKRTVHRGIISSELAARIREYQRQLAQ